MAQKEVRCPECGSYQEVDVEDENEFADTVQGECLDCGFEGELEVTDN